MQRDITISKVDSIPVTSLMVSWQHFKLREERAKMEELSKHPSLLRIIDHGLIGITAQRSKDSSPLVLNCTSTLDRTQRIVTTTLTSKGATNGVFYEATYEGIFSLAEETEDHLRDRFAAENCPAILFPYMRSAIANTTGLVLQESDGRFYLQLQLVDFSGFPTKIIEV